MRMLTGGIGTMMRGGIVIGLSVVLPKPWMVITQFCCGGVLIAIGVLRLQREGKVQ